MIQAAKEHPSAPPVRYLASIVIDTGEYNKRNCKESPSARTMVIEESDDRHCTIAPGEKKFIHEFCLIILYFYIIIYDEMCVCV